MKYLILSLLAQMQGSASIAQKKELIDDKNRLKAFLMNYTFSFRMPKGKSYKFTHTFVFN